VNWEHKWAGIRTRSLLILQPEALLREINEFLFKELNPDDNGKNKNSIKNTEFHGKIAFRVIGW
jgi:hypothetical protein